MRKMYSENQIKDIVNKGIEDGSIHADPSTEVKVGDINSESQTAGKVIVSDGEGGAEWGEVSGGTQLYLHTLSTPNKYGSTIKIISLSSTQCLNWDQVASLISTALYVYLSGGGATEFYFSANLTRAQGSLKHFAGRYSSFSDDGTTVTATTNLTQLELGDFGTDTVTPL